MALQDLIERRNSFWRGLQTARDINTKHPSPEMADTVARNEGAMLAFDYAIEDITGVRPREDAEHLYSEPPALGLTGWKARVTYIKPGDIGFWP